MPSQLFAQIRWIARPALILVVLLSLSLMLYAALGDSAIMDELAHIPSGYGYVRYADYRLNPEHPPLLKALSAVPLLFANLTFPAESPAWQNDVNGQWEMGSLFLYGSGNDADLIVRLARIGPILLTLALIVFIYLWSAELMGRGWALLPAFLFALSPHVLAHGHYVTTDIAAAFGVVLATYAFIKFLLNPSRRNLGLAGLAFGVAQLTKFSSVLLIPYFALLLVIFYLLSVGRDWALTDAGKRLARFGVRAGRFARSLIVIFAIGYFTIVYPAYFLTTLGYPQTKQTADTEFILASFANGPTPEDAVCKPVRCLADLDILMTKNPVTRPFAEYFLGVLMVLQRTAGGNTNYFMGEVSAAGWTSYFPTVYFLKEPIPVLLMILVGLLATLAHLVRSSARRIGKLANKILDYFEVNFSEFSMFLFVALYWVLSVRSPLNIGFRHLFPVLPFIYILTASAWKRWVATIEMPDSPASMLQTLIAGVRSALVVSLKSLILLILVVWFALETVLAAPYFLSYFNEWGGGVAYGYRYVTDSNYDWGQDLVRLQTFVAANPDIDKIAVDYFGGGNPKYYLGAQGENWWSARGDPRNQGIRWLAVSVNTLQGATQRLVPGQKRSPEEEYRWLSRIRPPAPGLGNVPQPDYRAGTSIFIYKL